MAATRDNSGRVTGTEAGVKADGRGGSVYAKFRNGNNRDEQSRGGGFIEGCGCYRLGRGTRETTGVLETPPSTWEAVMQVCTGKNSTRRYV